MKTLTRLLGFSVLFLFLSAGVHGAADGGGGNGVRGGGTGIYCDDRALILADEAVARDDRLEPELPTRLEILDRLGSRLARYPDLVQTIANRLLAHGPAERWPRKNESIPRLDVTFDSLYGGFLPRQCRLISVSGFARDRPGSVPNVEATAFQDLSSERYPILELHEAVFSVGVDTYGHQNAVLSQKLVGAIIARDIPEKEVDVRAKLFVSPKRNSPDELGGIIPLVVGDRRFCPGSLIFERTGGYGTQLSYIESGRYVSRRLDPHPFNAHFVRGISSGDPRVLTFHGETCLYRKLPWTPSSDAFARMVTETLGSNYSPYCRSYIRCPKR